MKLFKKSFIAIITILLLTIISESVGISDENSTKANQNIITNIMLVNNDNRIGKDYQPHELIKPEIPFIEGATDEEKQMEAVAAKSVEKLFVSAKEEGINLLATSAYRTYEEQKEIYDNKVRAVGRKEAEKYVAVPGTSEHQTGLCIDVTNEDRWFVESTVEAKWVAENAHKFGFILRYPKGKEHITEKEYEPWHIRYVGKNTATEIYEKGITLEEYYEIRGI